MCVPCVLQVSRAFTFKQQCQRSDQTLRTYLQEIGQIEIENNNFHNNYKTSESDCIDACINENIVIEENEVENKIGQFTSTDDETATSHLDNELVLDVLPTEIESGTFEGDIELSNLPSPVSSEDIQNLDATVLNDELTEDDVKAGKSESEIASKFDDYDLDDIKLDVAHVVSLSTNELHDQSIQGTFGTAFKV